MNKKYNIFIIAYWHDPRFKKKIGGLIRIFDLADNLIEQGHSVSLFLPKIGFPKKQTIAKVTEIPFIDLPILRPFSFHLTSIIVLLFKLKNHPALLYTRQMNSFAPMLIAKIFKVPSFFEIPNDPYLAYRSKGQIRRLIEKTIDRYSIKFSDKIVVLSEWSKLRLNQLGGIPLSKIIVSPSGTDTDLFRPLSKEECCTRLGLDPSFSYVGFVGSFLFHQGIDTLIDSAQNVLERFTDTRFLLVGDGPMMDTWKQKVNNQGLGQAFVFSGHVPYHNVPEYIGVMDICVAPHRKDTNQASPVKIFDYMACGRPIVASDIEVIREIIGDSRCALLVPPESPHHLSVAINSLIEDDILSSAMSMRARQHVIDNFDRKKIPENLIFALNKLAAR